MDSETTESLFSVWMSPSGKAYAGGAGGTLLLFDGAWTADSLGTAERISDLWGTGDNNVYAVGWHGNIFHFDGSDWGSTPSGLPYLSGVWGSSETDVFAVGFDIVHFDGNSWTSSSFVQRMLNKVHGSSQANVVAVGWSGTIGLFDGMTWREAEPNPWSPANPTTWIGEYNGMAIRGDRQYAVWCGNTWDESMNPVEQQIIFDVFDGTVGVPGAGPSLALVLEPGQPNPARRSTVFAWSMSQAGNVRLSLNDLAGRTVATLVEGWRSAGHHSLSWSWRDGSGKPIASGAYFVRLEAGGEIRTQKVLHLR